MENERVRIARGLAWGLMVLLGLFPGHGFADKTKNVVKESEFRLGVNVGTSFTGRDDTLGPSVGLHFRGTLLWHLEFDIDTTVAFLPMELTTSNREHAMLGLGAALGGSLWISQIKWRGLVTFLHAHDAALNVWKDHFGESFLGDYSYGMVHSSFLGPKVSAEFQMFKGIRGSFDIQYLRLIHGLQHNHGGMSHTHGPDSIMSLEFGIYAVL